MNITRVSIANFRGIADAQLHFDGHTLFVGMYNVGKSTICEAIDLVLSLDRLNKFPPVNKFDFYNSTYISDDKLTPIPLRIEVVLIKLSKDILDTYQSHVEYWHTEKKEILNTGEIDSKSCQLEKQKTV